MFAGGGGEGWAIFSTLLSDCGLNENLTFRVHDRESRKRICDNFSLKATIAGAVAARQSISKKQTFFAVESHLFLFIYSSNCHLAHDQISN